VKIIEGNYDNNIPMTPPKGGANAHTPTSGDKFSSENYAVNGNYELPDWLKDPEPATSA
jgi:hypothetical protein